MAKKKDGVMATTMSQVHQLGGRPVSWHSTPTGKIKIESFNGINTVFQQCIVSETWPLTPAVRRLGVTGQVTPICGPSGGDIIYTFRTERHVWNPISPTVVHCPPVPH